MSVKWELISDHKNKDDKSERVAAKDVTTDAYDEGWQLRKRAGQSSFRELWVLKSQQNFSETFTPSRMNVRQKPVRLLNSLSIVYWKSENQTQRERQTGAIYSTS